MTDNNQYCIDHLINYYTSLIELNNKFTKVPLGNNNYRYEDLVTRMLSIKQLIINKTLNNVNSLYKPTANLFDSKEHFTILEENIMFYRQNPDLDYPVHIKEDEANTNNESNIGNDEIKTQLSEIQESIKKLINDNHHSVITKSSNDTLAALNTNYELMKADLNRYDNLITHHINQTSQITLEAIEKEHSRFVQKISSDSNAIIDGIVESNITELEKQTSLIQTNIHQFDNKLFKHFAMLFFSGAFLIFACSILSSVWAANKALGDAKVFKIIEEIKTKSTNVSLHKAKL